MEARDLGTWLGDTGWTRSPASWVPGPRWVPRAVEAAGSVVAEPLLPAWEPGDKPSWADASHTVTHSPDTHGLPGCHQTCDRDTVQHAPERDGLLRNNDKLVLSHTCRNWEVGVGTAADDVGPRKGTPTPWTRTCTCRVARQLVWRISGHPRAWTPTLPRRSPAALVLSAWSGHGGHPLTLCPDGVRRRCPPDRPLAAMLRTLVTGAGGQEAALPLMPREPQANQSEGFRGAGRHTPLREI